MAERISDDRLEAVLTSVGRHLEIPVTAFVPGGETNLDARADAGDAAVADTASRRVVTSRRVLAVAAVFVMIVAVGAVVSPVRDAVADWLGLRHVEISYEPIDPVDDLDEVFIDGVEPIDLDAALRRSGLDIETVAGSRLGTPELAGLPPEGGGGAVFQWASGATTLWARDDATGILNPVSKGVGPHVDVEPIGGLGDDAVLIEGEHRLHTPVRDVVAGNVLWWRSGDREFRLESALPGDEMVEIAHQFD